MDSKDGQPELLEELRGEYTPPQKLKIAGIDAVVVDPHYEVLPYWFEYKEKQGKLVVVLHVDKHSDLWGLTSPLESKGLELNYSGFEAYVKDGMAVGQFICPAFHYGIVGAYYGFNPEDDEIEACGRRSGDGFVNIPITGTKRSLGEGGIGIPWVSSDGTIHSPSEYTNRKLVEYEEIGWVSKNGDVCGEPSIDYIKPNGLLDDLINYKGPLILDIDLDAFEWIEYNNQFETPLDEGTSSRLERTVELLSELPRPGLITIARSQTAGLNLPYDQKVFVHPDRVDPLQAEVIGRLEEIFLNCKPYANNTIK